MNDLNVAKGILIGMTLGASLWVLLIWLLIR